MAKLNKKTSVMIGAAVLLIAIAAAIALTVVFWNRQGYAALDDIDLEEYSLSEVDCTKELYVNQPMPEGELLFRNADGDERRARLSEADVTGFDTGKVGKYSMTVSVGSQHLEVPYKVIYKQVRFEHTDALQLSLNNAIELDGIYASCTDYNDQVAAKVPLREIFGDAAEVSALSAEPQTVSAEFHGASLSLEYTVGYFGYGYVYRGVDSVQDGTKTFRLQEFRAFLDQEELPEESLRTDPDDFGHGRMTVVIVDGANTSADVYQEFTFDWKVNPLDTDKLILSLGGIPEETDGVKSCVYHISTHTLEFSPKVMFTSRGLRFRLELDEYLE